jgi:kynureninase
LDLPPKVISRDRHTPLERLGGFLALTSPHAGTLHDRLLEVGVFTDYRAEVLRLGPAPYLSDNQLIEAISILGRLAREI